MFVLRSTCFQTPCYVYAQIYMPMFRSMSLWAPLHAYAQIYVFVCSVPCWCAQIYILVAMPCYSIALLSLDISLSCVLALIGGVQIQIPWSRPTSTHLGLYQRVWIISFMHVYVCLHASTSMFASLDLGFAMLHAPCGLDLVWLHPSPSCPNKV